MFRSGFLVALVFLTISVKEECSQHWDYYSGSCYSIGESGFHFAEAEKSCHDILGYLVEITSLEENEFVKGILRTDAYDTETGAYIGATKTFMTGWMWSESELNISFSGLARPWRRRAYLGARCATLSRADDWGWVDQGCGVVHGMTSICERCSVLKSCFQGSCYGVFCRPVSSRQYKRRCEDVGEYLVEINSDEENQFVKKFLQGASIPASPTSDTKHVWLGASDDAMEGDFRWMSGIGNINISFANWADGEPNNLENAVLCESKHIDKKRPTRPPPSPITG